MEAKLVKNASSILLSTAYSEIEIGLLNSTVQCNNDVTM